MPDAFSNQRLIKKALDDGWKEIYEEQKAGVLQTQNLVTKQLKASEVERFKSFIENYDDELRQKIEDFVLKGDTHVTIRTGKPSPQSIKLPGWYIVPAESKAEPDEMTLGDAADSTKNIDYEDAEGNLLRRDKIETYGRYLKTRYFLQSWSDNEMLAAVLSALATFLIFRNRDIFTVIGSPQVVDISHTAWAESNDQHPSILSYQSLIIEMDQGIQYKTTLRNVPLIKNCTVDFNFS